MSEDPNFYLAGKVGELTGVITTFQTLISEKLDAMNDNINGKIDENQCKNIVGDAIEHHREVDHKKASIPPAATIKISGTLLKKIGLLVGGVGGGGVGIWALIEKFFIQ